ncbi:uncharacterized protein LOC114528752 [Dendronephthya gigantea]|uniref:uncharacterized protein LOC114528752 n=1 Tax=Dendronephthya gigantea TaxID=151771 RepID=UPI00106905BA|nr:uncharacterized protein LOC114528752 [Dendronephthya gigantea]
MSAILRFLLLFSVWSNERVSSQRGYTLVRHANVMQTTGKIEKMKVNSISECLQHCLANCQCSTFDLRENDTTCYLGTYPKDPTQLTQEEGHGHFDIIKQNERHCDAVSGCTQSINCCLTSTPCLNNGTCSPTDDIQDRFTCACASGYGGKNCEARITSCRGYANGSRIPGIYNILDSANVSYKVFCDFEKDSNLSWTLVQSYSIEEKAYFQKPFFNDLSRNAESPENWHSYRISMPRMQSIQNDSTKWRITCEFDKNKTVNKTDFLLGAKKDVDILTYDEFGVCKRLEYANVRGFDCFDCTLVLYQRTGYSLHSDALRSQQKNCDLKVDVAKQCGSGGEDNFGFYHCQNVEHRCSATPKSTTQTWLGG